MYPLGKPVCEATGAGFDAVAKVTDEEGAGRRGRALAVAAPGRMLLTAGGFFEHVLVGVVSVGRVCIEDAACG